MPPSLFTSHNWRRGTPCGGDWSPRVVIWSGIRWLGPRGATRFLGGKSGSLMRWGPPLEIMLRWSTLVRSLRMKRRSPVLILSKRWLILRPHSRPFLWTVAHMRNIVPVSLPRGSKIRPPMLIKVFLRRRFALSFLKFRSPGVTRWWAPTSTSVMMLQWSLLPAVRWWRSPPVRPAFILRQPPHLFSPTPPHPPGSSSRRRSSLFSRISQSTLLPPVHVRVVSLVKPSLLHPTTSSTSSSSSSSFLLKHHAISVGVLSLPAEGVRGQLAVGSEVSVVW